MVFYSRMSSNNTTMDEETKLPPTLANALKLLASRVTQDRLQGLHLAKKLPTPHRQTALLKALNDKTNYIASLAAQSLADCATFDTAEAMLQKFLYCMEEGIKRDPGCHIRNALAFCFGRLEYQHAKSGLHAALKVVQLEAIGGEMFDTGATLRANAALALSQMADNTTIDAIAPLLFDMGFNPKWFAETRRAAAEALGRTGDVSARTILRIKIMFSPDETPEVLEECMTSLLSLEDPRLLETLAPYLEHEDQGLIAFAAIKLIRSANPEVIPPILNALERLEDKTLQGVLLALASMRSDKALPALKAYLPNAGNNVLFALIDNLETIHDDSYCQLIEEIATNATNNKVRTAASQALLHTT